MMVGIGFGLHPAENLQAEGPYNSVHDTDGIFQCATKKNAAMFPSKKNRTSQNKQKSIDQTSQQKQISSGDQSKQWTHKDLASG